MKDWESFLGLSLNRYKICAREVRLQVVFLKFQLCSFLGDYFNGQVHLISQRIKNHVGFIDCPEVFIPKMIKSSSRNKTGGRTRDKLKWSRPQNVTEAANYQWEKCDQITEFKTIKIIYGRRGQEKQKYKSKTDIQKLRRPLSSTGL